MFIIILLSTLVSSNALASEELRSLYGAGEDNRVTLCMRAGVPGGGQDVCDGALWQPNWVLVHGSCVAHRPLYPVVIVRDIDVECEEVYPDILYYNYRKVLTRFLHPNFPEMDFALICVQDPFDDLQVRSNVSNTSLDKLKPWLTDTSNGFSPIAHAVLGGAQYSPSEKNMMFASPVRMFMATVVLPLTFFIAFFLFVTFYTGSSKSTVRYRSLKNKEDSALA